MQHNVEPSAGLVCNYIFLKHAWHSVLPGGKCLYVGVHWHHTGTSTLFDDSERKEPVLAGSHIKLLTIQFAEQPGSRLILLFAAF